MTEERNIRFPFSIPVTSKNVTGVLRRLQQLYPALRWNSDHTPCDYTPSLLGAFYLTCRGTAEGTPRLSCGTRNPTEQDGRVVPAKLLLTTEIRKELTTE